MEVSLRSRRESRRRRSAHSVLGKDEGDGRVAEFESVHVGKEERADVV